MTAGEALYFDYVATLALQRSGHFVQSGLGVLAQHGLPWLEADFGLGRGLVLIDIGNYLFDGGQASVRLLRGLLRGLRPVAGVDGMLIGFIGFADASWIPCCARASVSLIDFVFEAVNSSSSLMRSRIGWVWRATYFLRAKGFRCPRSLPVSRVAGEFSGGGCADVELPLDMSA